MATTKLVSNPLSPLSQITEGEWPEYVGFLCEVHATEDSPAYGFPIYPPAKDGTDGTAGGRIFPVRKVAPPTKLY